MNHFNLKDIQDKYRDAIYPLIRYIKELGGIIDEEAVPGPGDLEEAIRTHSPLTQEYLGYPSIDSVVTRAAKYLSGELTNLKGETEHFRNLVSALRLQSTPRIPVLIRAKNLSPNPCQRLQVLIHLMNKYELPMYAAGSVTTDVRKHIVDYVTKFGHMSVYEPQEWLKNVMTYKQIVDFPKENSVLRTLAAAFVAMQQQFNIKSHIGSLKQISVEEADVTARDNNSKPGFGYPVFASTNAGNNRQLSIELAKQFLLNPKIHGIIPSIGQWRGQQGKNIILDYYVAMFPGIATEYDLPNETQYEQILQKIRLDRGNAFILLRSEPKREWFDSYDHLPDSDEEREILVREG